MMPVTPTPSHVPLVHHRNSGHEGTKNSMVLDLCLKKGPSSPNYPYDYKTPSDMKASSPESEASSNIGVFIAGTRPFKAYTANMLAVPFSSNADAYSEFRNKMKIHILQSENRSNENMRRTYYTKENADPTYVEKRKKNNEAAKRCRDTRRAKEDEIAIRCAFLEQERIQLKMQLNVMETELAKLRHWFSR